MRTIIRGGRVLDPASSTDGIRDILVEDGIIKEVAEHISTDAENVIEAEGLYVMPGLIDLHVHFREPGFEHKETIRTGARAAARGGFTTVCVMPNTKPVVDSVEMVKYVIDKAKEVTDIHVLPIAAITAGQDGEFITDFENLYKNGAVAVSEDGKSVMNARVARQAMRLAAEVGIPVFAHCEDKNLVARGVMNAGNRAKELGLYGIMNAVEDVIVARDILLAKETGVRLHLCHCSTEDSVKLVRAAKKEGLPVTAEVCPHHFTMTTGDITEDHGNFKMNPPLRGKSDVEALKAGLKEDIMDVIATDHAPHSEEEKNKSMKEAMFGIVGLETMASLTYTELVDTGVLTPMQMAEKTSYYPAKILGLQDKGAVSEGKIADLVIFDPNREYIIDKNTFFSKGKNTPFHGWKVKGEVACTMVGGKVVYEGGQIID